MQETIAGLRCQRALTSTTSTLIVNIDQIVNVVALLAKEQEHINKIYM